MNKENVFKLADVIENREIENLGFDMGYEYHEFDYSRQDSDGHACNTVACIAGWAAIYNGEKITYDTPHTIIVESAQNFLDIEQEQMIDLFYPFQLANFEKITSKQAAKTLRLFAKTGKIDWVKANPEMVVDDNY